MDLTIGHDMPAKKPAQNAFGQRLVALRASEGPDTGSTSQGFWDEPASDFLTTRREAEFPPAPAVITLASVLAVSTDELLGLKPAQSSGDSSPEKKRLWKRFQKMEALPTKDQRAVIRLINSLAGSTHAEAS